MAVWGWLREAILAVSLITLLVGALWASTGSFPPLVVVESTSMMHDEQGEVGAIDPGDLILVQSPERRTRVVTYLESLEAGAVDEGYGRFGRGGDVIVYRKNGGDGTPIIHRALLLVRENATQTPDRTASESCANGTHDPLTDDPGDGRKGTCILTWDVPGTDLRGVETVTIEIPDIECTHAGQRLTITDWRPSHPGYITLGDNNRCNIDQKDAAEGNAYVIGLTDDTQANRRVGVVRDAWIVGVASGEVPWFGALKLKASEFYDADFDPAVDTGATFVTARTWRSLLVAVILLIAAPAAAEPAIGRLLKTAPEVRLAESELRNHEEAQQAGRADTSESA